MSLVNTQALARTVLDAERNVDELGWDQPNLLFAVRDHALLEYVLQFAGGVSDRLRDLVRIGLRVNRDIIGLVLIVEAAVHGVEQAAVPMGDVAVRVGPSQRERVVMAVLRDGHTTVAVREEGQAVQMPARLPESAGDHDEVTELVRTLLGPPVPSPRPPAAP